MLPILQVAEFAEERIPALNKQRERHNLRPPSIISLSLSYHNFPITGYTPIHIFCQNKQSVL